MTPSSDLVATFSAQIEALTRTPVVTRRRGAQWTLTVGLRRKGAGVSFGEFEVRLSGKTAKLPDKTLQIVGASIEQDELTLRIRPTYVADPPAKREQADDVLAAAVRVLQGAHDDPVRRVFAKRVLRGIGQLVTDVSTEALAEAAEASTDLEVVMRALEQPEMIKLATGHDPLAPARLRGLRDRERLLQTEGGTWEVTQVADHLHLTRQGVNRRRRTGGLLALDVGRLGFRYPAWQFTRGGTLRGLESALAALRDHDPWTQLSFMLSPSARLDRDTPMAALRQGRQADVESAALALGEHGAA